ncbi:LysR substrate-binding domain-containing protein [Pseudomonas azotoformans]|uniref:LysR substrate-binding domain-containing protein n=1 Tax=Pseudomonas azotoformans TaxID=47878 RepID=UPI0009786741|nr:LysR substrate-binding domain-containing protein [Pseudomonas azotoformans]
MTSCYGWFENDGGVELEPAIQDVLHFVCRADHPLAQKEKIEWSDIASFDVVALAQGSGIRRLIDRQFPTGGVIAHFTYEVARTPLTLEILEQNDCVSVLPALALTYPDSAKKSHYRPIRARVTIRDIGFILPSSPLSATAQALKTTLKQFLKAQPEQRFSGVIFFSELRHSASAFSLDSQTGIHTGP